MSVGLYSGTSGLSVGNGLWRGSPGLWSGTAGLLAGPSGLPTDGSPSLIMDFVPSDPVYDYSLSLGFVDGTYTAYANDPVQSGAYINIQVWS